MDKLGLRIENTNFEPSVDDGRWDDVEWVEHQAELSACDDMLGKLEVGKKV